MLKPRVQLSKGEKAHDYHVVSVDAILGHAFLVPEFDDHTSTYFFGDKVW